MSVPHGDSAGLDPARLRSTWWEDAPAALSERRAPLRGDHRCRIAVVGAGIAGATCAARLARDSDGVVLLEATHPGDGATGRNAGFLLAESECFALAADAVGEEAALALRTAGLATRDVVRRLAEDFDFGLSWTGSVRLAADPDEAAAFERSALDLSGAVRTIDPTTVAEAGRSGPYLAALEDPKDGVLHPLRLLHAALESAAHEGLTRFDATPVERLDRRDDTVILYTPDGTLHAEQVVVATGAATRALLPELARPIHPVRAQALCARVDSIPAWFRPVYANRGGDYWRLLPDGRVLLGGLRRRDRHAEDTASTDATPRIQTALDTLLRSLVADGARIEVTHRWAGTMAFTPDQLPWAGPLADAPGVHVLAGFNGHGMGWAPGLATELADALTRAGPGPSPHFHPRPAPTDREAR